MVKGELLTEVAKLFKTLADYDDGPLYDEVLDELATVNAMSYILARRLGMDEKTVDERMLALLSAAAERGHELESEFSDMSAIAGHVRSR